MQGKIDFCEDIINQMVYQCIELTDEEMQIIDP